MQDLHINPTTTTPEFDFSPEKNIFVIRGISAPEDVRELYYPVIEWVKTFIDYHLSKDKDDPKDPLRFQLDLKYFNSSSAKFLLDIFCELKRLIPSGKPILIEWYFEEDDTDLKEAGIDLSIIAELEFTFIEKKMD